MAVTKINGARQIKDASVGATQVDATVIVAAGTNAFSGNQSFGGFAATNLANGSNNSDAATYGQLLSVSQGLFQKPTARATTTGALPGLPNYSNGSSGVGATLTATLPAALAAQDGVSLAVGDRLLVMNQASTLQNGLYVVTVLGNITTPYVLTRDTSMDASTEFVGALCPVGSEGATHGNTVWLVNWDTSFATGTDAVTFSQVGAGTYTAGTGISISGNTISVLFGTTSTTACVGNDARLSDARTPVGTALTDARVWVGSASNLAAAVPLSGDVTITNAGVATVANQVRLSKLITRETPTGTVNGSNTVFTLANTPVSGTEQVFLNGLLQEPGAGNDYTIAGATITFLTAPVSGDKIRVSYIAQ